MGKQILTNNSNRDFPQNCGWDCVYSYSADTSSMRQSQYGTTIVLCRMLNVDSIYCWTSKAHLRMRERRREGNWSKKVQQHKTSPHSHYTYGRRSQKEAFARPSTAFVLQFPKWNDIYVNMLKSRASKTVKTNVDWHHQMDVIFAGRIIVQNHYRLNLIEAIFVSVSLLLLFVHCFLSRSHFCLPSKKHHPHWLLAIGHHNGLCCRSPCHFYLYSTSTNETEWLGLCRAWHAFKHANQIISEWIMDCDRNLHLH